MEDRSLRFTIFIILNVLLMLLSCTADTIECEDMMVDITIQESTIYVTWSLNSCALMYFVRNLVNGVDLLQIPVPHPINTTTLTRRPCSRNQITIGLLSRPEAGDFIEPYKEFIIGFDGDSQVTNLKFNKEHNRFEWEAPENSEECELEYKVNYSNDINMDTSTISNLFYEFPLYFCSSNSITVTTIIGIDNTIGASVSADHSILAPDIKEVMNLNFDTQLSHFYWIAPERSELCNMEYKIQFENEIIQEEITTSNQFYEILLHPCSNNHITVTTILGFDDSQSDSVTTTHLGPITRKSPIHISTNPQGNHAETIWRVETETKNLCHIDQLRYDVIKLETGDETDFYVNFIEGSDIEFVLTPLEVGQMYQYRVCYVFSGSDVIICSLDVTFLTEPLPKPLLTIETEIDNNLQISWQQSSKFVTKYGVTIQIIEPNHFISADCYIDRTPIKEYFDVATTSYILENPKPSFKYSVEIESFFEGLGIATRDEGLIVTAEGIPGKLDVQSSYDILPSFIYEASLSIKWKIPCDINGKVERFSYVVKSALDSEYYSFCSDLVLDSGVITVGEGLEETYEIPTISRIFPFFKHSMEVVTCLKEHEGITLVDLGEAPLAYSPFY